MVPVSDSRRSAAGGKCDGHLTFQSFFDNILSNGSEVFGGGTGGPSGEGSVILCCYSRIMMYLIG
jgi:hypothetical protein